MSSSLIIEVCKIDNIIPHDNADKLELAIIKGWQCIVLKDKYKIGDKIIYIPIDSMIPFELSEKLNITKYLSNQEKDKDGNILFSRVRTIKLRGVLSQGLVIDLEDKSWKVGKDVSKELGIKKYEPIYGIFKHKYPNWRLPNYLNFHKYTDIENIKNYNNILQEGEDVVITEKCHGMCSKFAYLDVNSKYLSLAEKVKFKFQNIGNKLSFGLIPKYDDYKFLVGSHNCNIDKCVLKQQNKKITDTNISMDIFWKIALEYELDKKLDKDHELFGEIYGIGIQKYFEYDTINKPKIRFFDLKIKDKYNNMNYVDYDIFEKYCKNLDLPIVPLLYRGPFNFDILRYYTQGQSTIGDHIREGCVVKPIKERFDSKLGRVIFKSINDDYLLFKHKKETEDNVEELDNFDH